MNFNTVEIFTGKIYHEADETIHKEEEADLKEEASSPVLCFDHCTPTKQANNKMRVQKNSFLKTFFKSLPMCSIVPDCGSSDIKIAWGNKKNKVRPRNKEANADSVTDKDDQEDDIEDNIEEENDMNHDIPHTDVPDLLYVEEDEFTEKIDVNNHLKENVSEAEIENKVNDEINQKRILQEEKKMKPSETTPIHTSTNVPPPLHLQLPNEFCKPEVEVLNAGHEQSKTVPAALKPKEAFVTQSDKIKTKSNSEQKAKTRVAFADPTMSIQESQPSSPVATKVQTIEADELTLSSLSHEDTIEEAAPAPVENVPEDKPDKKPSVPLSNDGPIEEDKTEQMPPLESDPVFMEIEQTIKAKPTEAKSVNSIYIFVIKSNGKPVKRWMLNLRSSPGYMLCGSPEDNLEISPDCSIICDDQDFFKLASGQMNPQKAILTGKLKVRGNFLLLQKLQSIF